MKEEIERFDDFLSKKGLKFESIIIGGAALLTMGIINRATRDVDCLDPKIDEKIKEVSIKFAHQEGLDENWLNNGPEDLKSDLPTDWKERIIEIYKGKSITLWTLGRIDLLRTKLYAYCDRQQDLQDCILLAPTEEELNEIRPWLLERDANPDWPDHVNNSLENLKEEMDNG
ncbi:MAG: DUF6036 family nucleotidyltransferase [Lentisphaeraceae bacterium]|nr:DUF6036 family nucleotidyltransferase [Lentisphaeraceae bacterium]